MSHLSPSTAASAPTRSARRDSLLWAAALLTGAVFVLWACASVPTPKPPPPIVTAPKPAPAPPKIEIVENSWTDPWPALRSDQAWLAPANGQPYGDRDDVKQLAAAIAKRSQLDANWVIEILSQARYVSSAPKLMMPAGKGVVKNWQVYRSRFVESGHVQAGVDFWLDNADTFARAQRTFGVPAKIVAGLIGVETYYGRIMGNFRLLDALTTLSLNFPTGRSDRGGYFRSELEHFLILCHKAHLDPLGEVGSFAGAVGLPQFMPSSWRKYAVDFDGDGRIDLVNSRADAIGSVANYLKTFGWQSGQPTHFDVQPPLHATDRAILLQPDIVPTFTAQEMRGKGALLDPRGDRHTGRLALVQLPNGASMDPSYVAGTHNFYVITRYNHSAFYAMAVIELGEALERSINGS